MSEAFHIDEAAFGSWSARPFRSSKISGEVLAASRAHEDLLILRSLDLDVERIAAAPPGALGDLPAGMPDFEVWGADGGRTLVHVAEGDLDDAARAALMEAYAAASRAGERYEVVTPTDMDAQPQLRNARLVHACRRTRVGPGDRVRILHHLAENGESPLIEVSRAVAAPDAVECVLALACEGTVWVDISRTLGPDMPVRRLRARGDQPD